MRARPVIWLLVFLFGAAFTILVTQNNPIFILFTLPPLALNLFDWGIIRTESYGCRDYERQYLKNL